MPAAVVPHPPTTRRWRWYGRLGDEGLDAFGMFGGVCAGLAAGIATGDAGLGVASTIGFLLLTMVGRRVLRRIVRGGGEHQRRVPEDAGAAQVRAARDAVGRVEKAWPYLGVLDQERPGLVLAGSLWDLAGDLLRRAELRDASASAEQLLADLEDRDEPARAALAERIEELAAAEQRVDDAVTARVEMLVRLADACERQVIAQGTRARLEELTRRTDSLLAAEGRTGGDLSAVGAVEDPATELAERTEAVLVAYRELRGTAA
jgi:hypothetical protein